MTACPGQAKLHIEKIPGNCPVAEGGGGKKGSVRETLPLPTRVCVCLHRREKRAWEVGSNRAMPSGGTGTSASAAPTAPAELTS